ncbi:MAG: hypothetical protein Q6362_012005 [Candidatus Wukongarchaeota archaeon]|nr:hypothetical protein [Candidatus Wukongarchaeota archaeon]
MCSFLIWNLWRKKRIFNEALQAKNIDIKKVETVIIKDREGELYHPGCEVHYEVYAQSGKHVLFEIKNYVYEEDVNDFFSKSLFYEKKKKVKTQKVMVTWHIDEKTKQLCKKLGIEVITHE